MRSVLRHSSLQRTARNSGLSSAPISALGREGDASCEDIPPIRCDLGVSLLPQERTQHQAIETIDPLALSRQVTDRIKSSSYRLRQHQHTLHLNDRFASTAALHPAGEESRGGHPPAFIRGRPSSYMRMAVPTITSGVRLLLRLCRRAGRRLHDARLGDPVFARLRSSDAIRRPVRPFDLTDGGQAAPAGPRAPCVHRSLRAGS
jgi:hypothetical protein